MKIGIAFHRPQTGTAPTFVHVVGLLPPKDGVAKPTLWTVVDVDVVRLLDRGPVTARQSVAEKNAL